MEKEKTTRRKERWCLMEAVPIIVHGFNVLVLPSTWKQVSKELRTIIKDSEWMWVILLPFVWFKLQPFVALSSWIYVIVKTRFINKKEEILFKSLPGPVYRTQTFWIKVLSLIVGFGIAKLGVELMNLGTLMMGAPIAQYISIALEIVTKWFGFLQYFTFYRIYLHIWMAFGCYVNPMLERKIAKQTKNKKETSSQETEDEFLKKGR